MPEPRADAVLPYLRLLGEPVHIAGRGTVYPCALDRDTTDFAHLMGRDVVIERAGVVRCSRIERFTHCPPWREGEKIGVVVAPGGSDA